MSGQAARAASRVAPFWPSCWRRTPCPAPGQIRCSNVFPSARIAESAGAMVAFTRASFSPYSPSTGARTLARLAAGGEVP